MGAATGDAYTYTPAPYANRDSIGDSSAHPYMDRNTGALANARPGARGRQRIHIHNVPSLHLQPVWPESAIARLHWTEKGRACS